MNANDDSAITLAFSLGALKRLESPREAYANARGWSEYVGVISDRPQRTVKKYARDHDLPTNFTSRPGGEKKRSLADIKEVSSEAPRHVYIGTGDTDRELAEQTGWEYVPLEEAAEAAGWAVAPEPVENDSTTTVTRNEHDDWP